MPPSTAGENEDAHQDPHPSRPPSPHPQVAHFFLVALHAVRAAFTPWPSPARLRRGYDLLHVACVIIMPLLAAEGLTPLAHPLLLAAVDLVFPWRAVQPLE